MRDRGFAWSRSTVANYENGLREVELDELLGLLACASTSLAAVFDELGEVAVSESIHLRGDDLLDVVTGERALFADEDPTWSRTVSLADRIAAEATGDAERKAAKTCGVDPTLIVEASRRLWGRTLSRERDRRMLDAAADLVEEHLERPLDVGEAERVAKTIQARRGHVTRALMAELAPEVEATQRRRKPMRKRRKRK